MIQHSTRIKRSCWRNRPIPGRTSISFESVFVSVPHLVSTDFNQREKSIPNWRYSVLDIESLCYSEFWSNCNRHSFYVHRHRGCHLSKESVIVIEPVHENHRKALTNRSLLFVQHMSILRWQRDLPNCKRCSSFWRYNWNRKWFTAPTLLPSSAFSTRSKWPATQSGLLKCHRYGYSTFLIKTCPELTSTDVSVYAIGVAPVKR